jgi:hypothetical protein
VTQRIVTETVGANGVLVAGRVLDLPEPTWREIARQVGRPLDEFTTLPETVAEGAKRKLKKKENLG